MDLIQKGWFTEKCELWPGHITTLEIEKVLAEEKSDYQDILVLQTKHHGRALILDGIIQCTEFDEFSYQEMITFLPLNSHPCPARVLIVGGGDGGVAREVHKHPHVKECVQVEIDAKVIEFSKKYLPFMASGFNSEKLQLKIEDGFRYMREHQEEFDVIITDSSDPIGPAINLFTEQYFELLKNALKPNGIICSQNGTMWAGLKDVKQTIDNCRKHFNNVQFAWCSVPTYPTGQIGFLLATMDQNCNFKQPKLQFTEHDLNQMQLKYYNSEIHTAAFALPTFVKNSLK